MTQLKHLAIIMDGNRRWAKAQGLSSIEGHRRGYAKLKDVGTWCLERGITTLTVYAFSTENWNRSKTEVTYLMKLLERAVSRELPHFNKQGIRLRIIGDVKGLPTSLQKAIVRAENLTAKNERGVLNLCINYGGHLEIVEAVKKIIRKKIPASKVTEELITKSLWLTEQPDLVVRTSGEQRLSGFLTWQSVYSELYFTKVHWPAFAESDLDKAVAEYAHRQRRFGA